MKAIGLILISFALTQTTLAAVSDGSNPSKKMTTLFHCGTGSEVGFNGWYVKGLPETVKVYFENHHVEFFSHQAGNYSIEFTKKIDMVGYNDLNLSFDFEEISNCSLHSATASVSADGKKWTNINRNAKDRTVTAQVEKMNCLYLRVITSISFFQEGRFGFNRAYVQGSYTKPDTKELAVTKVKNGPAAEKITESFFIFPFEKSVNIETKSEATYEFVLSNLSGQVIKREYSSGSKRFAADVEKGIYFITIIQDNKLITTKKVVF